MVFCALAIQGAEKQPPGHTTLLQGPPHPKIQTTVQWLAEQYALAPITAKALAESKAIDLVDDAIVVVIEAENGQVDRFDAAGFERFGGDIEARSERLLRVRLPLVSLIDAVESVAGIAYVRLPYRPRPLVVSEGVDVFGANDYHDAGYTGQNTDIAVIDLGFVGLSTAQGAGELSNVVYTHDYTGTGLETQYDHGTAVAEIVEDVAPGADLHLLKVSDEVALDNAAVYCVTNGIDVIVHSVGWYNTCFYDGTGAVADVANDARDSGILWINAAGNEGADGHWQGGFSDADGDGNLNFGAGSDYFDVDGWDEGINVTLSGGDTLNALLTWDDWDYAPGQGSDQDYELFLIDSAGILVAFSSEEQSGTQEPNEWLTYAVPAVGGGMYELMIYDDSAPAHPDLDLFVYVNSGASTSMQYHRPASSIVTPANSAKVLAVGAMDYTKWETGPIASYSSRGPSNTSIQNPTSVVRPDIVGPDTVSTYTYGANAFAGTSAATPHIGGAAALLLSEDPSRTADQIQGILENNAVDMGTAGKDNTYGSGSARLVPGPPPTAAVFRVTHEGDVLADGTVHSAGGFAYGQADVAEWVTVSGSVEPGDVVKLDADRPGAYRLADGPCSERVAGVISTAPGVALGGAPAADRALLALIGIVPVKVTDEGGPIRPGDLLVTSSAPGAAMRWADPESGACALVGKALEPMTDERGVILVLLTAH